MKPTLLIMAAGIGSRYGTLKQIDRLGPHGETIIDYSVYDAIRAGFGDVVFIIRKDIEKDFREVIFDQLIKFVDVKYVFQELSDVPDGIQVSIERIKPWGTGHAIWTARDVISNPFAVINADDFYGYGSFEITRKYLSESIQENHYCLTAYELKNTLSEHGFVSRGVCEIAEDGSLKDIVERTEIKKDKSGIVYKDESGNEFALDENTIVSMNMWGFKTSFFEHLSRYFSDFIKQNSTNSKSEFVIPSVINSLVKNNECVVDVINSNDKWFGMTYKEDRDKVRNNINQLISSGVYPERLWTK